MQRAPGMSLLTDGTYASGGSSVYVQQQQNNHALHPLSVRGQVNETQKLQVNILHIINFES